MKLGIMTLNCGHHNRIMDPDGKPYGYLIYALGTVQGPAVVALQDLKLSHSSPKWKVFRAALLLLGWQCPRLNGPSGVTLIYSSTIHHAVEIIHWGVNLDVAGLRVRSQNDQKSLILTTYIPHSRQRREAVTATIRALTAVDHGPHDQIVIMGDFNEEQHPKRFISVPLTAHRLKRVPTPPTSQRGNGSAQAIWTNVPLCVVDVEVHSDMQELSDAHNPLMATLLISHLSDRETPFRASSMMRTILNPQLLGAEMEKAETYEELLDIIHLNTVQKTKNEDRKKKKRPREKKVTRLEKARRKQKIMRKHEKAQTDRRRAWRQTARTRPRNVKRSIFPVPVTDHAKGINSLFRSAIGTYSHHKNVPKSIARILAELEELGVPEDVKKEFERQISMGDVLFSRQKLKAGKSYGDYPAAVAQLMGPKALEIIRAQFVLWTKDGGAPHVVVVGIATNKPAPTDNVLKYIQKTIRPIGISTLFRAWFQITQTNKISKVVSAVAPPNMYGFIRYREVHEMIIQSIFRIEYANKRHIPLYGVKMDFSKCFDKIAHILIEACDKVTGGGQIFQAISRAFADSEVDIRISEEAPAKYRMSSGGPQGDARIPGIWAIISATLGQRLEQKTFELDRTRLIVAALMFADDIILTASKDGDMQELVEIVFDWAEEFEMPVEIKEVAANELWHAMAKPHEKFRCRNEEYTVAKSMRCLGACLHFCEDSPCPKISCPKCQKTKTVNRVCPDCVDSCLREVQVTPTIAIEKIALYKGLLFGSMAFGAYTCTRQQVHLKKTMQRVLMSVQGPGYKAAAHLGSKLGGYGMHDTEMEIAISTATMLDRILSRSPRTLEIVINYCESLHDYSWPKPLMHALQPDGNTDSESCTITAKLHKFCFPSTEKSQAPLAEIRCSFSTHRFVEEEDQAAPVDVTTCTARVSFSTSGTEMYIAHEETAASQHSKKNEEMKRTITLARILEKVSAHTHRVALVVTHSEITLKTTIEKAWRASKHPRFFEMPHRDDFSIIARTTKVDHPSLPEQETMGTEIDCSKEIPTPYPLMMTFYGLTVKSPADSYMRERLTEFQLKCYFETRQMQELFGDTKREEVDFENSACTAGRQCGYLFHSHLDANKKKRPLKTAVGRPLSETKNFRTGSEALGGRNS